VVAEGKNATSSFEAIRLMSIEDKSRTLLAFHLFTSLFCLRDMREELTKKVAVHAEALPHPERSTTVTKKKATYMPYDNEDTDTQFTVCHLT